MVTRCRFYTATVYSLIFYKILYYSVECEFVVELLRADGARTKPHSLGILETNLA